MEKLGLGGNTEGGHQQAAALRSPGNPHRLSILRCIQWLAHACRCQSADCALAPCQKLKRVVQHSKGCTWKTSGGCPVCKQLIALCCYHAKLCREVACPVLLCPHIKQRLRWAQTLRKRTASSPQRAGVAGQQQGPPSPTPAAPAPAQAAEPQFTGTPPPVVEAAVHGQGAGHVHQQLQPQPQMPHAQTFQRLIQLQVPQMIPMAPLGVKAPAMARGLCGCLEPRMGPAGMQQHPPWALGGLPQPQQRQAGPAGPAWRAVTQHGQPLRMAPQPGLGQVIAPRLKPGSVSPRTLRNLLRILRSPSSPLQQQQVLSILLANPQLLAIFVKQRIAKYISSNLHSLPGQPGMPQGQPGLQPPALPGQQGVHANPAVQNRKTTQMGVQRASLPQQQSPQQLQPPLGGMSLQAQRMNMNLDTMPSQFRDAQRRQQRRQQMGNHSRSQPSRAVGYPAPQQQHHMQQAQPGSLAQPRQRPQALGAQAGASLQAYQQRLLQQQMGCPAQPNPMSPQQRMLPNRAQSPHLQAQQIPSCLSRQVRSPQPVPSPWPQSQHPHSSLSPGMQPQPAPQHVFPQTGSLHPGLVVAQASPME